MAKTPAFKIPKKLAECADLLGALREERKTITAAAKALEEKEKAVKEFLINNLPKSAATGISGKNWNAKAVRKTVPSVENWPKFYAYVAKNKAWELLQKRLSDEAVRERWDAGKSIPGVGTFDAVTISLTKV